MGQSRPGGCEQSFFGQEILDHIGKQALHQVEHFIPFNEGHLEVELGKFELAVAAQVFIAHTARNLKITIHPGHHQQLFELLGRLRQSIEGARLQARRNQKVTGPFRGGFEQEGGFDFDEFALTQVVANEFDDFVTQNKIFLHSLAAQIEVAIFQAYRFVHIFIFINKKGQGL